MQQSEFEKDVEAIAELDGAIARIREARSELEKRAISEAHRIGRTMYRRIVEEARRFLEDWALEEVRRHQQQLEERRAALSRHIEEMKRRAEARLEEAARLIVRETTGIEV
ncbi:hypothetical protein [Pyrodictium abyssi]|uniref:ATPase n=1 Tax=Pyrodictium abyssi TaxID=54256 RepID=A0ABN6ZTT9_9CREN|nr:hypothetical protein PABY_12190 [Pyrodictium abyssi]